MLHYYFTYVLFALTFQATTVTPAPTYPLTSNNTLGNTQKGLVHMNADLPTVETYQEVHPCWANFDTARTKLYKFMFTNLQHCAKKGIAFWPKGHDATCGLVWLNMGLNKNQGATWGTCFLGPEIPRVRKLLSPCHRSFRLSQPPIYSQLKSKLSLVDCQTKAHAVAWRVLQGQGPKPMCIELPTNENDLTNAMGANGYCTVDPEGKHKEWYLQQALLGKYHLWKRKNSDWVAMNHNLIPVNTI